MQQVLKGNQFPKVELLKVVQTNDQNFNLNFIFLRNFYTKHQVLIMIILHSLYQQQVENFILHNYYKVKFFQKFLSLFILE